jgi:hypothetical protein
MEVGEGSNMALRLAIALVIQGAAATAPDRLTDSLASVRAEEVSILSVTEEEARYPVYFCCLRFINVCEENVF